MNLQDKELKYILSFLNEQRGFNFNGYRNPMLQRRLQKRVFATHTKTLADYHKFILENTDELDNLIDVLTINVSCFFRNALIFEILASTIIPEIFSSVSQMDNVRIWSAGCAYGEEPYSISMILKEFFKKEEITLTPFIIGTDIDKKALKNATAGCYETSRIEEVKYAILKNYFTKKGKRYCVNDEIKEMVQFAFFDLLDKKSSVPKESIFGNFDIVMCRNVLIYFDLEYQKIIFNKLYKALKPNGILVLGESETPLDFYKQKFERINNCCKIYRKID